MSYKIVADSSCDTTKEMEERYNVEIAPLSFTLDGVEYIDDETLDLNDYLDKIDASKNVPKSACPSITEYLERFEGDADWVFGVTLSSELSGSYNSAIMAKDMFLEKYPDKKIHIFNSRAAASMEVLIVLKLGELCEQGNMTFEEIVDFMENYIDEAKILFVLDKIDTLEKNGRLSFMKARIVQALNLKLILDADQEGKIGMKDKARGSKKALKKMVDLMPSVGFVNEDTVVVISHCRAKERAEYVKNLIKEAHPNKEVIITHTKGLSSTYSNDGGIVVSFR